MTTETGVTRLQSHQINAAGEVLGRAFSDDPMTIYVVPEEAARKRKIAWFMRAVTNYGYKYGDVYTTGDHVEGGAVWLPPGGTALSPQRMMMTGMIAAPLRLGWAPFSRFMNVMNCITPLHKRDVPAAHWYLMNLGVDPPRQGQGVGSRLIQPILARADAERLPCYLETMKERNLPFYRRHGFEVVVEDEIPKGGPRFWTMRRDPKG